MADFTDVTEDYWGYEEIADVVDKGLFIGTSSTTFEPETTMSRAMFVTALSRLAEVETDDGSKTQFTDVPVDTWYTGAVAWAADAEIVLGVSSTKFDPHAPVTREQMVTLIVRYADWAGIELPEDSGTEEFKDAGDVSDWAVESVARCRLAGLIEGMGGGIFAPRNSSTRAQVAAVYSRFCALIATESISADDAIVGVEAIGFVDTDGTKLSAIAVEYSVNMTGADVDEGTYTIDTHAPASLNNVVNYGDGEIGDIIKAYVNDEPDVSATGGTGTGKYVIIEVYTDYVRASEPSYLQALAVGVIQSAEIKADSVTVTPGAEEDTNYTVSGSTRSAIYGTFTVKGLESYKLYTNESGNFGADGPAYTAYDCFNEKDGTTYDYDLGYALYVPEDYDPNGSYALVTVDHTISAGAHPYEALLTNYGPTYFISDEAQKIVKDTHGLDGLIVVVPLIIERVDDNSCVPAMWMALVELWDHLAQEYNVDENHIYGAGQSMGGMLLMQTNTNRDNYFAGMLCYGNQWGQNYYKDTVFARGMSNASYVETAANTPRHYPSTADSYYIWDYHWGDDGEKVYEGHDSYNFYYLISDDNMMVLNGSTNALSNDVWMEMSLLYQDLTGYTIPRLTGMDAYADLEAQNQMVKDYLAAGNTYGGNEMGLYWCTWEGGANDATAIWSRRMTAGYEWLLSQTRETEMERAKLDLNKPFELADEQIQDESRLVTGFHDKDTGEDIYFLTGKAGSGTQFYNTSWLQAGSNVSADANPGWLPEGMTHSVTAAAIEGSIAITDGTGKLTAVAVKYNVNMENIVIHLKGDNVIDSKGNLRADDFVILDPYNFYDAAGNQISCTIKNVYVNSSASVAADAARGSGSGNYVIVEIDTDSNATSVGVIQRTTVRTNEAIASATSKLYSAINDISADDAIVGVTAIGYMAADGAKLSAIAVEYNVDLTSANVNAGTYAIDIWTTTWNNNCVNFGDGEIGDILNVYVNDEADVSDAGGTGTGKYVIIEVYTDYQYSGEQNFARAMSAGITQKSDIAAGATTITSSTTEVANFDTTQTGNSRNATYGTYVIKGTEGFKYYYTSDTDTPYPVDGPAFVAENCFNEQTGVYETVVQSYALYLPENYDPNGNYALVTVDHPASTATAHPLTLVYQSRGPSYFISEEAQNLVKETHGLDGLIVVVPTVTARVGDNAGTPSGFPALVKLWDYLIETYPIDENYIYGAGQSVGGMVLLETNTKRDNFFAGILLYDNQWAQNYYKDEVFVRGMATAATETASSTPRHYPSTDSYIAWDYYYDDDGNKAYEGLDPFNYYWMTSDDNIMITNSKTGNALSTNTWTELNYLYKDLVGYEIPKLTIADFGVSKNDQNQAIGDFLENTSNQQGIWWVTFEGGSNQVTPIWSRSLDATYEWLLTQTRETEMERAKLDLNKPFELAETQDTSRVVPGFTNPDGSGDPIYCLTGKAGSGTKFYNTSWLNLGSVADKVPGWLPEGMSHPVEDAAIEGVTAINTDGKLTAVAIKYNVDMANAVIWKISDPVINSKGIAYDDYFVIMDTYDFYDESGVKISGTITNIYTNDSPEVVADAERGSGAGNYVIVEIDTDSDATSVGIIQRATVRTNKAIASPSSKMWMSADAAIVGVTTIGFVDTDGAKTSAIVVEYNVDLTGADVGTDTYSITGYGIGKTPEIGSNPGAATRAYVSDEPAISEEGGTGTGKYVIIEVNTDYQLGSVAKSYKLAMAAGVTQTGDITAGSKTITASATEFNNYDVNNSNYALDGTYTISGTEVFELYTKEDETAFPATDCWEEATGEYIDVDLPYALYVPEDYDSSKEYAVVLHIHDAGFLGDDPMITLTESQGPVNYASAEVQQIAKDQGLGGIIVVCPQINSSLRSTRDDYSLSAAVPATWQLMDYITEAYNIDMNRIYGEGQSMGGMQVVAMAAQRDNYFAGLWANGCQWGSNFNLDDPTYNGTGYFAAPADGEAIWTTDADGNDCDYRNWYYMVSDDNILITNCKSDNFSTSVWKEFKYLYLDLAGAEIPYAAWNPLTTSRADQNAAMNVLAAQENDLGIYWQAFDGGNHMATWIYSHGVSANYEWLLTQTRDSEMTREKLPLDRPFERAEEQSTDSDRSIASGTAYLVTGKYGAGTDGYNSALYGRGGNTLIQAPGWTVG